MEDPVGINHFLLILWTGLIPGFRCFEGRFLDLNSISQVHLACEPPLSELTHQGVSKRIILGVYEVGPALKDLFSVEM